MKRFQDLDQRIDRQRENRIFKHSIMPAAWLVGLCGLVGLILCGGIYALFKIWPLSLCFPALIALCFPAAVYLFRSLRGHFNDELDEP